MSKIISRMLIVGFILMIGLSAESVISCPDNCIYNDGDNQCYRQDGRPCG